MFPNELLDPWIKCKNRNPFTKGDLRKIQIALLEILQY